MGMRTRHAAAVDAIAGWLLSGRYAAHSVLPREDEIGEELEVSRTVVREAMRTLVAKGMVVVRRRHGTEVQPMENWSLFDEQVLDWRLALGPDRRFVDDLMRFRIGIETMAGPLAAENPAFPLDALSGAYVRMAAAVDGEGDYKQADLDFHKCIMLGTKNQFIAQLVPMMGNALRVSFDLSVLSMDTARGSLPMHKDVLDAIADRAPARTEAALRKLIESARDDILSILSEMGGCPE
ncbi:FadR family transcriptional regulator [Arsenicitalea aurantiaca]|uniref:FadR family transcriptional regulator n=1 Tax=Arsenicitalea aurantiaca TaxID=1783274 RepID=A0A433XLY4_9HYPH|nr:FadR/GntR family transcriptional regulator [Arsenicitalea aurantiaca]RUT35096.1 FadR family transcriptional regulator [Arsenicitalea aurantiaca]